jgi:hypothetical protein
MVQILFFNDKQKIPSKQNLKFRSDGMYLESIIQDCINSTKMDCKKNVLI